MKIILLTDTHTEMTDKTKGIHQGFYAQLAEREAPEYIIHTGDWGACKPSDTIMGMHTLRQAFPNATILGVLGNHDYWNRGDPLTFWETEERVRSKAKDLEIQLLDGTHIGFGCARVFGFDGWYAAPYPPTNDSFYIKPWGDAHTELQARAEDEFEIILNECPDPERDILITHFPSYTKQHEYRGMCGNLDWMEQITQNFAYYIVGHSHQDEDFKEGNCRIINVGSDYDKPKYKVLELS